MDKCKLNHAKIICFILQNIPLSKPRKSSMKCSDLRCKFNKCSNKTCRARELKIKVFFFFFTGNQNNIVIQVCLNERSWSSNLNSRRQEGCLIQRTDQRQGIKYRPKTHQKSVHFPTSKTFHYSSLPIRHQIQYLDYKSIDQCVQQIDMS